MKKLLVAILLVFSLKSIAQDFEGTINWSIRMEITDPKIKAQMEEAQKNMQDPEKIKEMQQSLNDPQVKAMMEQNPQLKAQMEKALAMMQSGGINSMIPKGMIIKLKDGNMLSRLDGGFIQNDFLFLKGKDETYMIDHSAKTYVTTGKNDDAADSLDVKVTKTNESINVLNYPCTKYLVETTASGTTITQNVWATTALKGIDFSAMAKQQRAAGSKQALYFKDIDGVPLKMEMKSPEGLMTMEVTSIKRESLPRADFVLPADYKETKQGAFGF